MWIDEFKIKGYRSIEEESTISIEKEVNILIGRNNSGKSAVIDSLRDFRKKFASSESPPNWDARHSDQDPSNRFYYELTFCLGDEEWDEFLRLLTTNLNRAGISQYNNWKDKGYFQTFRIILPLGEVSPHHIALTDFGDRWMPILFSNHADSIRRLGFHQDHGFQFGSNNTINSVFQNFLDDFLENWRYVESFRRPKDNMEVNETTDLNPDGWNLVQVLHTLNNNAGDRFDEIIESYRSVMDGVTDIDTPLMGRHTTTAISETGFETAFRFEDISAGSKEILTLITQIILSEDDTNLLLVEEPELHLHPNAERKIYNLVEDLASKEDGPQVIISTHSDVFVNQTEAKNVIRVDRSESTGNTSLMKAAETGTEEVLLDLGYTKSDLFRSSMVVFVEGPSDQAILTEFAKTLSEDEETNIDSFSDIRITVHSVGGGHMEKYGPELANIVGRLRIPYLFILDSDDRDAQEKKADMEETIRSRNIKILNRYSIESYLLESPKAISHVFEFDESDVATFIEESSGRPNPKSVLKDLLSEFEDQPMSYDEVEHGRLIARHMDSDEISGEIAGLMREIQNRI